MDYKSILGIAAIVLGFIGYFPYVRDTLQGTTRPHLFSWVVWGVIEATAFFAQTVSGAGAGAWAMGASAVVAFFIAGVVFTHADKQIVLFDWFALAGAFVGIVLWRLTANPLLAIISVTIADGLGFVPTFRKAYHKPHEETVIEYVFSSLKFIVAFLALGTFTVTTMLYPASVICTNAAFAVMALVRRRALRISIA
ncbi:hypothetical protein HY625_01150 [Candidatus Uhrbacteria bacterium]|nr:hypothetical protein [Candidatus Uhrbacteria bacterium]